MLLTFPVSVDRSSPPITLMSPVDWSFCFLTHFKNGQINFKGQFCVILTKVTTLLIQHCIANRQFAHNSSNRDRRYLVTLEANEVHSHWNGTVAVAIKGFDVIQKVCKKLVAPLKHTESYDMVASHVLHDFSGQTFGSAETDRQTSQLCLLAKSTIFQFAQSLKISLGEPPWP